MTAKIVAPKKPRGIRKEVTVKVGDTVRVDHEVRVNYGYVDDDVVLANSLGVVSYVPDEEDDDRGWVGVTWAGGLDLAVRTDEVGLVQIPGT